MTSRPRSEMRGPPAPVREGDLPLRLGGNALSWPGVLLGVLALGMVQATLLFAYGYLSLREGGWPPPGVEAPGLARPAVATLLLVASGVAAVWLHAAARRRAGVAAQAAALAVALLGAAFLAVQVPSYAELPVAADQHAYGSALLVNGVVHHAFAVAGVLAALVVIVQAWGSEPHPRSRSGAAGVATYWYFVVADWLLVAAVLYVSPAFFGGGGG